MATCAAIPARVPSLSNGTEALEEKRAVHKASKKSMDALLDLDYWDQECAIRTIDLEEAESSHACMMKEGVAKYRSADDLVIAETNFASKKARITEDISQARQQRGRLQNILEKAESERAKDLRMSR
jgi:hypothetical protein